MPGTAPKQSIVGLHYLRALATVLVVVNHSIDTASFPKYFGPGALTSFFRGGAGEIDFFFIMSGLIMVSSSTDKVTGRPKLTAREFLRRRAERVIPMLWFAVILFNIALFSAFGRVDVMGSLRAISFWPVGDVVPFVAWTIRYEVVFYLVFSLCFLWQPQLWPLMLLWCGASLARFLLGDGVSFDDGSFTGFLFSPYNIEFGFGILIGLAMRRWRGMVELPGQLAILIVLVLGLRAVVQIFDLRMGSLAMILSIAPLTVGITLIAAYTTPPRVSRLMMALGDASYSIFLLHPIFMSPILLLLAKVAPGLSSSYAALATAAISTALGYWGHIAVEKRLAKIPWSSLLSPAASRDPSPR